MKRGECQSRRVAMSLLALFLAAGCTTPPAAPEAIELSDEQVENIVRLSYQHVALYFEFADWPESEGKADVHGMRG